MRDRQMPLPGEVMTDRGPSRRPSSLRGACAVSPNGATAARRLRGSAEAYVSGLLR